MKRIWNICVLMCVLTTSAQQADTLQVLGEVVVISTKKDLNLKQAKPLANIEEYLQQSSLVSMIRRGNYAWEPMINSMSSERTLVTIEGMHIFGACTDKMDPITSYIEISNLSEATVSSGQHGSGFGATIGGAVDLKRSRPGFSSAGWKTQANLGYETNGSQKIAGASASYSTSRFFADSNFMFRDADNYSAGNGREVVFSQFRKMNLSATAGARITDRHTVETSMIYDKATDVGYPALPMDVSLAEALIGSVRHEWLSGRESIGSVDTKIYFNTVTHRMDDSARPDVPIRMDMPGWSTTFGGYSSAGGTVGKNKFRLTLNTFTNRSKAEMTMYPENPEEIPMYMLTWPDVRTTFGGISGENLHEFTCHSALKITASAGYHANTINSADGLQSIRIFAPEAKKFTPRLLKSAAVTGYFGQNRQYSAGVGYGERAPSVSEGYGFYLFNSFDNFDYIGNPALKNEKSLEGSASFSAGFGKFKMKISGRYFHIRDYIIGIPDPNILPMTIGAEGIKVYRGISHASILTADGEIEANLSRNFQWKTQLAVAHGRGPNNERLPFMSPLRYHSSLSFIKNDFHSDISLQGHARQSSYAASFGEDETPSFAIVSVYSGYMFRINSSSVYANAGIENILDTHYSTFSDWNNVPRQGRNFFINLILRG